MNSGAALRLLSVGLALATLLAYSGLRDCRFVVYDTTDYVLENPHVRAGLTAKGALWAFSNVEQANWHPLAWLSHMLDVELFGVDPVAHKRMNLAIHVAASVCLLWVLFAMTGALGPSAFVAGVFALHPTHVESVAWVAERKDVLSALFWILAMASYAGWVRRRGAGRYAATLGLFAAGLMAKPMVVTFPFVLLLLDHWPLGRDLSGWRRLLLEKLPFFALSLAISVVTFLAQREEGAVSSFVPYTVRVATAAVAYVAYLWKAVWPLDLAVLYPHPGAPAYWKPIASVLLLALVTRGVLWQSRGQPYLAVGWFWFLGTLVPVIGLVQVGAQWIADRYTYLPYVGLSIMVAWGLPALATRAPWGRPATRALGAAALLAFLLLTRTQVGYWADTQTLFGHALELTERNWIAHHLVGVELFNRRELAAAIEQLERSAAIEPDHVRNRANLGAALLEVGRLEAAARHLAAARRLEPGDRDTRFQLAKLAEQRGQLLVAQAGYGALLADHPDYAPARRRTGIVHYRMGELETAREALLAALELEPESAAGQAYLGRVLEDLDQRPEAIRRYRLALELEPGQRLARQRLDRIAASSRNPSVRDPSRSD